ncbi:TRAP transporter small permease subunit [Roseateles saccharophilus]|uniref:TRAP transporter small permease protein n=1 Tax=Roseateles saccharophilus TaxID=304 RepID=A0A4R3VHL4_ROSSA|nr:TRAP transporter small permease subunit [Roseateles saccharophilus]MDG0832240.1 TRAP transporter small permease subunit [Roseateles saccharophilus]TCV02385.1 TRAP-type mannitol/chloroaromatic compound transport system permease small subunit [Roseateles saccharophilus]
MDALLAFARRIDSLNDRFGKFAAWAVLLSCFISAANAVVRYGLDYSSNAFLEIQWYLFAACVMLGAAQVLRLNEHVRVDLIYGRLGGRGKVWVDLAGLLVFLLPVIGYAAWLSWGFFLVKLTTGMAPADSVASLGLVGYAAKLLGSGEMSSNAGGLIRWPAALTLPLGFALVWLQGLAEVIKRIAWLQHRFDMDTHYERPLQ